MLCVCVLLSMKNLLSNCCKGEDVVIGEGLYLHQLLTCHRTSPIIMIREGLSQEFQTQYWYSILNTMFNNVEWKRGKKTLKQIFNKDLKSTNININCFFLSCLSGLYLCKTSGCCIRKDIQQKKVPNQNMWSYLLWKPLVNKEQLKVALLKNILF